MSLDIAIDRAACNGYGNCVVAAPELFDIDPETNIAFLLGDHAPDDSEAQVREAEEDCPVRAITVTRAP